MSWNPQKTDLKEAEVWLAEYFYYVNYGSSIITLKIDFFKIPSSEILPLYFPRGENFSAQASLQKSRSETLYLYYHANPQGVCYLKRNMYKQRYLLSYCAQI